MTINLDHIQYDANTYYDIMTFTDVINFREERSTESLVEQAVGLVRWLMHNLDDRDDNSNDDAVTDGNGVSDSDDHFIEMVYVQVFKAPVQCFTLHQWWPVQCGEKSKKYNFHKIPLSTIQYHIMQVQYGETSCH